MSKPAFTNEQHQNQDGTWNQTFEPGMSLLEYYAGQALQGLMANPERYNYIAGLMELELLDQEGATQKNVNKAFLIAEAMIKESEKRSQQ